jgi:hypothetical protein
VAGSESGGAGGANGGVAGGAGALGTAGVAGASGAPMAGAGGVTPTEAVVWPNEKNYGLRNAPAQNDDATPMHNWWMYLFY